MSVKPGSAWWILGMGAISTHGEEPKYPDAGPVIDLILTPSGTSVTMSWLPPTPLPGVVPPVGYVVKLEETGETVDVTDTNYIWDGLQIDTSYCFSVYSKSELGTLSDPVTDCVVTLKEVGTDDAAQITHTGTSTFAISNPTRGIFEYYLSRSATDFSQASLISNPSSFTVARNAGGDKTPYYILTTYPGVTETSLMRKTSFVCTSVTYRYESVPPTCTPNCDGSYLWPAGDCYGKAPNCCTATQSCWGTGVDGACSNGGYSCCGGSRGQNCTPNPDKKIKNSPPAGYTERYGEWVNIDTSPTRGEIQEKDTGVFTIKGVEWDDKYYMEIPMPPPHPAQVFDENGAPTGELLDKVPAWDYTDVYFIHYDIDGNVVWMKDHINDPECFTVVQKTPMTDYEMWVSHLPTAYEGTYEFVIANPNEEFVRVEGNV